MSRSLLCLAFLAVRLCVVASQYFHPSWWSRFGLDQVTCGYARQSSQPFIGNDAFLDFTNVTYIPGSDLHTFAGVKIFLHPVDVKEFSKASSAITKPFVLTHVATWTSWFPTPIVADILNTYQPTPIYSSINNWWAGMGQTKCCSTQNWLDCLWVRSGNGTVPSFMEKMKTKVWCPSF